MSKLKRGFEVLDDFKEKVVDIMKNNPESYNIPDEGKDNLSASYGDEDYWLPKRSTIGSAGYDIRSIDRVVIEPMKFKLVGTGLTAYMQIDEELQIRPRSGLAFKKGITVLNSPGTIDSDYYGKHIGVIIYNTSSEDFIIEPGDRIAQAVFSKYLVADGDSTISDLRNGGFGSTGIR